MKYTIVGSDSTCSVISMESVDRARVPIPVVGIVVFALIVVGLLLASSAAALVARLIQLAAIAAAFLAIGALGWYLWKRGDISGHHD